MIEPPNSEDGNVLSRIHDTHAILEEQLRLAKAEQKHHADKNSNARELEEGDYVLLSTRNLTLHGQSNPKLRDRFVGPFKVLKKISSVVNKLELPDTMSVHPVFHITKLKKYHSDDPEAEISESLPIRENQGGDYLTIHKVLDHAIGTHPNYKVGPCLVFKVRWDGHGPNGDTWEPYGNIRRTDEFTDYVRRLRSCRTLAHTAEYLRLHARYPSRFPSWAELSSH